MLMQEHFFFPRGGESVSINVRPVLCLLFVAKSECEDVISYVSLGGSRAEEYFFLAVSGKNPK